MVEASFSKMMSVRVSYLQQGFNRGSGFSHRCGRLEALCAHNCVDSDLTEYIVSGAGDATTRDIVKQECGPATHSFCHQATNGREKTGKKLGTSAHQFMYSLMSSNS